MSKLPAEKLYDYLDVAESKLGEGHLWLVRQILRAVGDIAEEDGIGLPQKYYSLIDEYHSRAGEKLLEKFLASYHYRAAGALLEKFLEDFGA
jgi:hypothetical protein